MSAMIVTSKSKMTASYTVNGTKSRFKIGPPAAGTDPVPVTADPTDLKVYDYVMALKDDKLVTVTMSGGSKAAHEAAVTAAAQNGAASAGPDQATLDALDEAQSNAVSIQKALGKTRDAAKVTEDALADAQSNAASLQKTLDETQEAAKDTEDSLATAITKLEAAEESLATEKERADTTEEKLEASEQRAADLGVANKALTDRVAEMEASAKGGK